MTEPLVPVTYSLFAPDALLQIIAQQYALPAPLWCRLHRVSWNSTYLLGTRAERFAVRVYGATWRSRSEIMYELDLLQHVAAAGCHVAAPVPRSDGTMITPLLAPEGPRALVVFAYAPGAVPQPFPLGDAPHSAALGRALAMLHSAAETFATAARRSAHTAAYFLDQPLAVLQPLFTHRPADWQYLQHVAAVARTQLEAAAPDLSWGVVHGDPFSANATMTEAQQVTWYDFDLCGPGWHLEDIAKGYASAMAQERPREERETIWQAFLRGYRSQRPLSEASLALIPAMMAASTIHLMAANALKGPIQGYEYWGSDAFLDDWMQFARQWMAQIS